MRLLILNHDYYPLGGNSGIVTKEIAERLTTFGHDVTVFSGWHKDINDDLQKDNLQIIRIKSRRKYINKTSPREMLSWISKTKRELKQHLKNNKYDLCIANFTLPSGEIAYSTKLLYKLPYVILSYGPDIPWLFPKKMMWYHAFTYQWIRKICLQSEQNYVSEMYMKENIDLFVGKKFINKNKLLEFTKFSDDNIIVKFEDDLDKIVFRQNLIDNFK